MRPTTRRVLASLPSTSSSAASSTTTAHFSTSTATASTSFFPVQPAPSSNAALNALPKPPSSLWFTGRPSLNTTLTSLSDSLTASRTHLFKAGLLPSITSPLSSHDPNFTLALPHPRQRRWKSPIDMATYLRNGTDLRSSQYKKLTALLANLEGLLPYAQVADALPDRAMPELNTNPISGLNLLGHQTKPQNSTDVSGLTGQIEELLERFVVKQVTSDTGIAVNRVVGKERRLGKADALGRIRAVGRRKESAAQVWILPTPPSPSPTTSKEAEITTPGRVVINSHPLPTYFTLPPHRTAVVHPMSLTSSLGSFNVFAIVKGGGLAAQAEAVAMGIARALVEFERTEVESGKLAPGTEEWRDVLKKAKLLERDPRMVERKKTGQPKARKKNTWVKR